MKANKNRKKFGRIIYFILASLFTVCIITQFYLAGVATFLDAGAWMKHMMFVHLFGFHLPIFMLIGALIGALPRQTFLQLFGVFVSIFLMYFTANMNSIAPWVGPLHVIIAIFLFTLSCVIVFSSWKSIFYNQKFERDEEQ